MTKTEFLNQILTLELLNPDVLSLLAQLNIGADQYVLWILKKYNQRMFRFCWGMAIVLMLLPPAVYFFGGFEQISYDIAFYIVFFFLALFFIFQAYSSKSLMTENLFRLSFDVESSSSAEKVSISFFYNFLQQKKYIKKLKNLDASQLQTLQSMDTDDFLKDLEQRIKPRVQQSTLLKIEKWRAKLKKVGWISAAFFLGMVILIATINVSSLRSIVLPLLFIIYEVFVISWFVNFIAYGLYIILKKEMIMDQQYFKGPWPDFFGGLIILLSGIGLLFLMAFLPALVIFH